MKRLRKNKGFTLIELLIASAIFVSIITVAGAMLLSGFRSFIASTEIISGQAAVRQVILLVSKDLRKADTTDEVTCTANTVTISPSGGDASAYSYDGAADTIAWNGTTIAAGISAFSATESGGMVTVTVSSGDGGGYSLSTNVTLR